MIRRTISGHLDKFFLIRINLGIFITLFSLVETYYIHIIACYKQCVQDFLEKRLTLPYMYCFAKEKNHLSFFHQICFPTEHDGLLQNFPSHRTWNVFLISETHVIVLVASFFFNWYFRLWYIIDKQKILHFLLYSFPFFWKYVLF